MKTDAGMILTLGVVAAAGAGLYWRQTHKPQLQIFPASSYSQPYRPDFPEPPKAAADQKAKKDKDEFQKALELSEKANPYAHIPAEAKSKAKKKTAGSTGVAAGGAAGEIAGGEKKADGGGVFLAPEMDPVTITTTTTTTTAAPAKTATTATKSEVKAATTAFPAGTGKTPSSTGSSSSGSSSFRGPDIPALGSAPATPTPVAQQVATTDGSKATATPRPDPRIPPSTFNPGGGRLPAGQGQPQQTQPTGPIKNPYSPAGQK